MCSKNASSSRQLLAVPKPKSAYRGSTRALPPTSSSSLTRERGKMANESPSAWPHLDGLKKYLREKAEQACAKSGCPCQARSTSQGAAPRDLLYVEFYARPKARTVVTNSPFPPGPPGCGAPRERKRTRKWQIVAATDMANSSSDEQHCHNWPSP